MTLILILFIEIVRKKKCYLFIIKNNKYSNTLKRIRVKNEKKRKTQLTSVYAYVVNEFFIIGHGKSRMCATLEKKKVSFLFVLVSTFFFFFFFSSMFFILYE